MTQTHGKTETDQMIAGVQGAKQVRKGHWLLYGDSGSGKSTSASTWPGPKLVIMFDPWGKEMPYKKQLMKDGGSWQLVTNDAGVDVEYGLDKQGELQVQIEHYIDKDPRQPVAYQNFLARMDVFGREEYEGWKTGTIILDSVTFMEIAARKWSQYKLNSGSKEPRQWFAASTDMLEEMLMIRFGALAMNVVVIAHIDEDKDEVNGEIVRNPSAPGRMRKRSPAGYSELYYQHVVRDEKGNRVHQWQTRNDGRWNCATQFEAPNPCRPVYEAIW